MNEMTEYNANSKSNLLWQQHELVTAELDFNTSTQNDSGLLLTHGGDKSMVVLLWYCLVKLQ